MRLLKQAFQLTLEFGGATSNRILVAIDDRLTSRRCFLPEFLLAKQIADVLAGRRGQRAITGVLSLANARSSSVREKFSELAIVGISLIGTLLENNPRDLKCQSTS